MSDNKPSNAENYHIRHHFQVSSLFPSKCLFLSLTHRMNNGGILQSFQILMTML